MTKRTERIIALVVMIVFLTFWSLVTFAQVTQPAKPFPVAAFFEPVRNFDALKAMGVNTLVGPEVENARAMPPGDLAKARDVWVTTAADMGFKIVLKNPPPTLPAHCVGVMLTVDEPNGKAVLPAQLKPESDAYRAKYPGVSVFLSLAGDKVTSANFNRAEEAALYRGYVALADVLTVDTYSANRNATRYPMTWTGEAVKKLALVTDKPVWAWIEVNDQQLSPPPAGQGINRAPTPDEIRATWTYAVKCGAKGIGAFLTCDSGKFGWPASYFPQVDRNGASMQPQYDAFRDLALAANPAPPPQPTPVEVELAKTRERLAAVQVELIAVRGELDDTKAKADVATANLATEQAKTAAAAQDITAIAERLKPTTQPAPAPATQPTTRVYLWTGEGMCQYEGVGLPVIGTDAWFWENRDPAKPAAGGIGILMAMAAGAGYIPIAVDEGWTPDQMVTAIDGANAMARSFGLDPTRLKWIPYGQPLTGPLKDRVWCYSPPPYAPDETWTVERWNQWVDDGLPRLRADAAAAGKPLVPIISPHPVQGPADPVKFVPHGVEMLRAMLARMDREGLDCVVWMNPKDPGAAAYRDAVREFVASRQVRAQGVKPDPISRGRQVNAVGHQRRVGAGAEPAGNVEPRHALRLGEDRVGGRDLVVAPVRPRQDGRQDDLRGRQLRTNERNDLTDPSRDGLGRVTTTAAGEVIGASHQHDDARGEPVQLAVGQPPQDVGGGVAGYAQVHRAAWREFLIPQRLIAPALRDAVADEQDFTVRAAEPRPLLVGDVAVGELVGRGWGEAMAYRPGTLDERGPG